MKAQMFNYSAWIEETDPAVLLKNYSDKLSRAGFCIEGLSEKHFQPQGYTALFLLSESHFAIHTFPEHQTAYIELSSCVKTPFDVFVAGMYQNPVNFNSPKLNV